MDFPSKPGAQERPSETEPRAGLRFPVVALGASAGGLEALTAFFTAMPPLSGRAFILVVHLDPQHVSILPELLQKHTSMPVSQASDGDVVQPDHAYVIPPNRNLSIEGGVLKLVDIDRTRGMNLPIDLIFNSLARDQGATAVGIVLSGNGSDGTEGIKSIKDHGGVVLAQEPESAKYDGMPRSAVASGMVDFVLPPQEMPEQLLNMPLHPSTMPASGSGHLSDSLLQAVRRTCRILAGRTGHDFSHYKANTLVRRIERRMVIHQIDSASAYVQFLQESQREAGALFKDLLIGVTSFFRDPEAFEFLGASILSERLAGRPEGNPIRVWVPGCSSGEEAYSLAILLFEVLEKLKRPFNLQLFGTDLDEDAIAFARAGLFQESALVDLAPERVERFFTREAEGGFRVRKMIREKLVFAVQNVTTDPPFTKLSLLSCRNLIIYLDDHLQRQLFPIFHYSLEPGGILFLGSSETIGSATDLFDTASKKWKIFLRNPSKPPILEFLKPRVHVPTSGPPSPIPGEKILAAEESSTMELLESILQQSPMPPYVVINGQAEVLYIHGHTGPFLELAPGRARMNILDMARPSLKADLVKALRDSSLHGNELVLKDLFLEGTETGTRFNLTIRPLHGQGLQQDLLMVIFQEIQATTRGGKTRGKGSGAGLPRKSTKDLESEIRVIRERLQITIEELETANEELRSTNEELQSTNEELQSTNEELETSKEELQSMNEESITVNQELQAKVDQLAQVNDDLLNLLDSTDVATLFLDSDLAVRRFTTKSTEILPLTGQDTGRPIQHFATSFQNLDLAEQGRLALKDLSTRLTEARTHDSRVFLVKTRPYKTTSNLIDGVVITFNDITEYKELLELKRLAVVVRDSNDAIALVDSEGKINAWNRGAELLYGYSEIEALTMSLLDLVPPEETERCREFLSSAFLGQVMPGMEAFRVTRDGRRLRVWVTATLIPGRDGEPGCLATTERDISTLANITESRSGREN